MKQLSLGLHNYHETFSAFPQGQTKLLHRHCCGGNWRVQILPFIEQANLYSQTNYSALYSFAGNNNHAAGTTSYLNGVVVNTFVCPSSSLDTTDTGVINNPLRHQVHHYVGVSGSLGIGRGTDRGCDYGGIVRGNGLLGIMRHSKFRDAQDGTSNTIIVAEQSALIRINGTDVNRTSNYYGGWSGQAGALANDVNVGRPHWGAGTTCLRYRINTGNGVNVSSAAIPGADNSWDFNTVMNSYHPGGIHIGLADGSVRFVSENINFATLQRLCSMNDGQPIGEF